MLYLTIPGSRFSPKDRPSLVVTAYFRLPFGTILAKTSASIERPSASPSLPLPTTGIFKADMDVLLGKANIQVVQLISIAYPFECPGHPECHDLDENNVVVGDLDSAWVAVREQESS